jgi:hypothetical protein
MCVQGSETTERLAPQRRQAVSKKSKKQPEKPLPVFPDRQMAANFTEFRGRSRGDMPNVLRQSDAAKLIQCPECSYSGGRHSRSCSKSS